MLYTIKLENIGKAYTFKVELPFETYFLDLPSSPLIEQGSFDHFTYDDSSKEYHFFSDSNEEINVNLTDDLKAECDTVISEFHSLFDTDHLQRTINRVEYHLEQTFPFKNVYSENVYFYSELGYRIKGDWYYKDYLKNLIDSTSDTGSIQLVDFDAEIHNVNKAQLQLLLSELNENLQFIEQQRINFLVDIRNKTSIQELNDMQEQGFNYIMKDFRNVKE